MSSQRDAALDLRVASLNRVMRAHRGGVEVVSSDGGQASVRFQGMCTGCTYRPICAETMVRPALTEVEGVVDVNIIGIRVNEENRRDLTRSLAPDG